MQTVRLSVVAAAAVGLAVAGASPAQAATASLWNMDEPAGASTMTGSPGPSGTIGNLVTTGVRTDTSRGYSFPGGNPLPPQPMPGKIVTVPDSAVLRPGAGAYSISLRLKTGNTQNGNVVQKGQAGARGGYVKVELHAGRVYCTWIDKTWTKVNPAPSSHLALSQPMPVNQWTTVTCARATTPNGVRTTTLTVNGHSNHVNRWVGTIDNNWELSIGGKSRCSTYPVIECDYYQGVLDYVKITTG